MPRLERRAAGRRFGHRGDLGRGILEDAEGVEDDVMDRLADLPHLAEVDRLNDIVRLGVGPEGLCRPPSPHWPLLLPKRALRRLRRTRRRTFRSRESPPPPLGGLPDAVRGFPPEIG